MQKPEYPRRLSRMINHDEKRRVRNEWKSHAARLLPKTIGFMRKEILDAFKRRGLDEAKQFLEIHIKNLQQSEKGIGKGFTQEQTAAMIENLKSFFSALEKKAK